MSTEKQLAIRGVFAGHEGLRRFANASEFWEGCTYGTRFYFGHGGGDYLHHSILRTAVDALDDYEKLQAEVARLLIENSELREAKTAGERK